MLQTALFTLPNSVIFGSVGYQSNWTEVLSAPFMRDAMIAGALVAITSAIIGYFVVLRRDTFASHALGHIGFPGATGAVLLGLPVSLGLFAFCLLGAVAIGVFGKQLEQRDVATGTTLAFSTALGVLFASLAAHGTSSITSILFGNLLAVSHQQLIVFAAVLALVIGLLCLVGRPLLFASVSPQVAQARGINTRLLGIVFLLLLALVTALAIQVVGTLLLFSLLVTPVATALAFSARPLRVICIAASIGLVSVICGLILGAMFNVAPSFFIVTISTSAWLVSFIKHRHDLTRGPALGETHHH